MADDNVIKVGTQVDVSGLQSGMSEASTIAASSLDKIKADYATAAAQVKAISSQLAEAQKQFGAAAAQGFPVAQQVLSTYESELNQAKAAMAQAQAAQSELSAETVKSVEATLSAVGAESLHASSLTRVMGATTQARFSAQLLGRELGVPLPRALSSIAAQSSSLGPLLAAAFPIIGAVALGEVLITLGEKVYKLYQTFVQLKQVEEEVSAAGKRMASDLEASFARTQGMAVEHLRSIGDVIGAASLAKQNIESEPIDLRKWLDTDAAKEKLKALSTEGHKDLQSIFTSIIPSQIDSKIAELQARLAAIPAKIKSIDQRAATSVPGGIEPLYASGGGGLGAERAKNEQLQLQTVYADALQALRQRQSEYKAEVLSGGDGISDARHEVADKAAREAEQAASQARAAMRAQTEALRNADQESFADLQADHELSLGEIISYWQKRVAAESYNAKRVQEINRTLGNLYQQRDKENDRAAIQGVEESIGQSKADGGASGELEALQSQQSALAAMIAPSRAYVDELTSIMKRIPGVAAEAMRQENEEVKKGQDDLFKVWESTNKHTEQDVIDWWNTVKGEYSKNAPLMEDALNHITQATERLRAAQEKQLQSALQLADEKLTGAYQQQTELLKAQSETGLNLGVAKAAKPDISEFLSTLGAAGAANTQLDQQMLAVDKQYWAQKIALAFDYEAQMAKQYGVESQQYLKALNDRQKLQNNADKVMMNDQIKLTLDLQKQWQSFFNTFNQGFTNAINGAITGQKSFGASMEKMFGSLILQVVDFFVEWGLKEAEKWAMSKLFASQNAAVQSTALAAQQAETSAANVAVATSDAAVASAGTFAFWSMIDPPTAPAMAALAYGEGLSIAALAAFETGGIVPNTGVALVHEGEGIMNKRLTDSVLNSQPSGGDTNTFGDFHYHASAGVGSSSRSQAQDMYSQFQQMMRKKNMAAKVR